MNDSSVSLLEIVLMLCLGSMLSIGGGNGFVAIMQSRWVTPGHLDPALFAWVIALGHLTPGPKAGFIAGVGYYLRGLPGALAATLGILIPSCLSSGAVAYGMDRFRPVINRISPPASFVVSGLIAATAWETAVPMSLGVPEVMAVAAVAYLVGRRDMDPVWAVLGAVGFGGIRAFLHG